ncbi:MAG: efflux RND transporter periplasmic adaptor subunit [Planctomycetaceae bacterium]|nr:efflux RND transporter periplasmic adaptor subunit [Planctomycetaceae bacterium]
MANSDPAVVKRRRRKFVPVLALVVVVLMLTWTFWFPVVGRVVDRMIASQRTGNSEGEHSTEGEHAGHDDHDSTHDGHDHGDHADASAADTIELSAQARQNLGLSRETVRPVVRADFRRSITIPAVMAEQPGRTRIHVAAPMTGVVTHVHAVEGETVLPGSLLFEIRLTHEDLVQAQVDFLKTLGELDVELREIARLKSLIAQNVAITERSLLEREYSRDKLQADLQAQRESLRLHGLSERQVEQVAQERRLLRDLRVVAPGPDTHDHPDELQLSQRTALPVSLRQPPSASPVNDEHRHDHAHDDTNHSSDSADTDLLLTVRSLNVVKGQAVSSGQALCELADYRQLFIEALAFEHDAQAVLACLEQGWPVEAVVEGIDGQSQRMTDLNVVYVSPDVDPESRTLRFFLGLENSIVRDTTDSQGRRFVVWNLRPGQRLSVRMPVEEWKKQIVLPANAVVRDGAEFFVFRSEKTHFDRVPVHVRFHDRSDVVISDDGKLRPGDLIAMQSAHQLLMALKAKSGAVADPHAGHNH